MNAKDQFFIEQMNDHREYHNALIYAFGKFDAITVVQVHESRMRYPALRKSLNSLTVAN